jgi:NTP pyrophosphatase (non-canonical NTP hydrolase)
MKLSEYQTRAALTDRLPLPRSHDGVPEGPPILVPLLGLAGEVGSLLTEYKKHLRDGHAHRLFREQVREDLGDLLWYVADVATKFGLDLDDVATANLAKTQDRWPTERRVAPRLFDEGLEERQQLPRRFEVRVTEEGEGEGKRVRCYLGGEPLGDPLTDNAYEDDGYRFHDVFHLAHAAMLGWSPIFRSLMRPKRKREGRADEVEDGGRAKVIEEAVAALVYDYAQKHNFLEGVDTLDYSLLKKVKGLVTGREVEACSLHEWEEAILAGYRVWRQVWKNRGGLVVGDLLAGSIEYTPDAPPPVVVVSG